MINQNPQLQYPLEYFVDLFSKHCPDLLENKITKFSVGSSTVLPFNYYPYMEGQMPVEMEWKANFFSRTSEGETNVNFTASINFLQIVVASDQDYAMLATGDTKIYNLRLMTDYSLIFFKNNSFKINFKQYKERYKKKDLVSIGKTIMNNPSVSDHLKYLFLGIPIDQKFVSWISAIDTDNCTFRSMQELVGIITAPTILCSLLKSLTDKQVGVMKQKMPNLDRLSLYLSHPYETEYLHEAIPHDLDYIQVTIRRGGDIYVDDQGYSAYHLQLSNASSLYGYDIKYDASTRNLLLSFVTLIQLSIAEVTSIDMDLGEYLRLRCDSGCNTQSASKQTGYCGISSEICNKYEEYFSDPYRIQDKFLDSTFPQISHNVVIIIPINNVESLKVNHRKLINLDNVTNTIKNIDYKGIDLKMEYWGTSPTIKIIRKWEDLKLSKINIF